MEELIRLLTLQDANTRVVLAGVGMLGLALGVVGALAVLRKRSLMGDAIAHAALPGVCGAFLIFGERSFSLLLLGALIAGGVSVAFVSAVKRYTRIKEDAAIALSIGGFFGLGIALSGIAQNTANGNQAGLDGFIFGKAASMVTSDAWLIAGVGVAAVVVVALLSKEFRLLCFDSDFASGQGWPTLVLDLALMSLVCVCTVAGLPAVGVVLVVALLVIPPVAARFWTDRMGVMLVLSGAIGMASGVVGVALSATVPAPPGTLSRGWPTGPMVVLVAASVFMLSLLVSPRRGLLADAARRVSLRRRIAMQNLLRDVYEALEPDADFARPWRSDEVARHGSFEGRVLARAQRRGLIARAPDGWSLTAEGRGEAARVVRAHRLWELFLIERADIAPDHVDRDADQIEHLLSPSVVAMLEARLASEGRLPGTTTIVPAVPESPHPIEPPARRGMAGMLLAGAAIALSASRASASDALFHIGSYGVQGIDVWTVAIGALCAASCGLLGCFLVLRRMSLLGDAISHAILPGLGIAFLMTGTRDPWAMLAGAAVVGVLTAVLSAALHRWGRVPEDASMGVVFTTLFALGVVIITFAARDVDLDPGCVLYGSLEFAGADTREVLGAEVPRAFMWLGAVFLLNIALVTIFYKELKIVCFDPALAATLGFSAWLVHYTLMAGVASTCVASFESVGSILVIAMLVAPGATAHLLTDRLSRMLIIAVVVGAISAVVGYVLAVVWDTSVAGMIAAASLAIFGLVALVAPRHGVIARVARPRRVLPPEGVSS
ncbi:MAG: metal ABC transporter permease [Phycisphaerales bacterium]|nr:metal ABC transporter permease [Phycisphaerales bacterium]